jgi:cyanophycin synthetase
MGFARGHTGIQQRDFVALSLQPLYGIWEMHMELQSLVSLRGPNIWARFPVLEVWVNLENLSEVASSEIPGFNERLKRLLPGLWEHRCSVGEPGGFFQRLERGTYLAHIFEHVVLELQSLAGTPVVFGRTRLSNQVGIYKVAIEYQHEELGRRAVDVGRDLCLAAVHDQPFDVSAEVEKLRKLAATLRPDAITQALLEAARARKIPTWVLEGGLLQLGYGRRQRRILDGQLDHNSAVGNSIAYDLLLQAVFFQALGIPFPTARQLNTAGEVGALVEGMPLRVVLRPRYRDRKAKPLRPLHTLDDVMTALEQAQSEGWTALLQERGPGDEYRLLVSGHRVLAVRQPKRNDADFSGSIHPALIERVADAVAGLRLELAEVEVIARDLAEPLESQEGMIAGVSGQPDLLGFLQGGAGALADALVSHLFADPSAARIPIVAVTGTNGKTTTTRLTAHLLGQEYAPVGMTCTEGIYLGQRRIVTGDCSGPKSARTVLHHPAAAAAVLETARGGILREGLGFDRCDVAVITNIGEGDHLGSSEIDTLEQLAWVKSTVVWAVAPGGTAVLNAADPLVVDMARWCEGEVCYFARKADHPVIVEHCRRGGRAVFCRGRRLVLAEGNRETALLSLTQVPLTRGGRVGFHVENVLAASAAAWALGIAPEKIAAGLQSFDANLDFVPARFNLLDIQGVTVVLDYGHNTSALGCLIEVLEQFPHQRRSVVYSAAGDRRDSDIIAQGEQLGGAFDRVYLYEDTYLRGRAAGAISALFREGLAKAGRVKEISVIPGGMEAIETALAESSHGDLLVVQPDLIDKGVALLKRYLDFGGREISLDEALAVPTYARPSVVFAASSS